MSNDKCQYCGRPLAGEICPAHGYVGNPIPMTPTDAATSGVPTGAEMMWPVATPPAGWLIEDGSSQLIASYPDLSALIRGTYGGADATHFYLPDGRGVVPVGYKSGDANFGTLGGTGGEATHALAAAESGVPPHAHMEQYTTEPTHQAQVYSGTGYSTGSLFPAADAQTVSGQSTTNNTAVAASAAHNNLQPYRTRNYVIKT